MICARMLTSESKREEVGVNGIRSQLTWLVLEWLKLKLNGHRRNKEGSLNPPSHLRRTGTREGDPVPTYKVGGATGIFTEAISNIKNLFIS